MCILLCVLEYIYLFRIKTVKHNKCILDFNVLLQGFNKTLKSSIHNKCILDFNVLLKGFNKILKSSIHLLCLTVLILNIRVYNFTYAYSLFMTTSPPV
jgi:hypothetical protein